MSLVISWHGDYGECGEYRLAAYHCLGGAKWSVSRGDDDCFARGKVPWSADYDCLERARRAAVEAMADARREDECAVWAVRHARQ